MELKNKKKAIIIGGSRGIGKEISISLKKIKIHTFSCSRKDIDTSDLDLSKKIFKKTQKNRYSCIKFCGPRH